jgi:hypothetical protein
MKLLIKIKNCHDYKCLVYNFPESFSELGISTLHFACRLLELRRA